MLQQKQIDSNAACNFASSPPNSSVVHSHRQRLQERFRIKFLFQDIPSLSRERRPVIFTVNFKFLMKFSANIVRPNGKFVLAEVKDGINFQVGQYHIQRVYSTSNFAPHDSVILLLKGIKIPSATRTSFPERRVNNKIFQEGVSFCMTDGTQGDILDGDEDDEICPVDCVKEFKTDEEFSRITEKAKKTKSLVVVDFYRTACGSCKYIEQGFTKLCKGSGDHEDAVIFLKHNVIDEYDEQSEVAERLHIKTVPLFHFYRDGVLLEAFPTRDKERILAAINKYL